jgi:predicted nucleic acid-binding Zn ribbon protein
MPVYEYEHIDEPAEGCTKTFELTHSIHIQMSHCPDCGLPITKIVSRFSHRKNVLSTSNIKEKGFRRLRRKDKGVYEED